MDYLALLCTIHGDGPQTLQRLRRRGIRSLGDVVRLATPDLEAVLGRERVDAERFQREALHLQGRVEGPSDGMPTLTASADTAAGGSGAFSPQGELPAAVLPAREASPPEDQVEPEVLVPPLLDLPSASTAREPEPPRLDLPQASAGAGAPVSPLDALLRVLQGVPGDPAESSSLTQRLMSRSTPPVEAAPAGPSAPERSGRSEELAAESPVQVPRREAPQEAEPPPTGALSGAAPTGTPPSSAALPPRASAWETLRPREAFPAGEGTTLETLCSDRVDREMIARLEARGFRSLEELVALDARRGAQRAGLAYTQMLRLQFLARRALR